MRVTIKSYGNRDSVFDLIELIKSKYELERKDMKLFTDNGEITVSMQLSECQVSECQVSECQREDGFGPAIPEEELPF